MNKALAVLATAATLLAGCDKEQAPKAPHTPVPKVETAFQPVDSRVTDQWLGKWTGVEGLNLTISADPASGPGHYILHMQYGLDTAQAGTFKGQASPEGIVFNREDGPHALRAGDGQATGLKWLADKKTCLIVQPGEGYCRS
ncbi:hypothetical protein [Pseudomonas sp. DC3000-4b1]|uniref:hypothetical protein n=1 Tax=unclassified Pseudomonas TaxID=196821 RepID=UPI003CF5A19E